MNAIVAWSVLVLAYAFQTAISILFIMKLFYCAWNAEWTVLMAAGPRIIALCV